MPMNIPGAITGAGNILSRYFGDYTNPSEKAQPYLNQLAPQTNSIYGGAEAAYNPYIQAGQRQIPGLESQFGQLVNNPGDLWNKFGAGYKESPGFQFALKQALGGIGNAQAAGGLAGSPQHQQMAGDLAENLANKDFMDYMSKILGLYQTGLGGQEDIFKTGFGATQGQGQLSSDRARAISEALISQANNAYAGQREENQRPNIFSDIAGIAGSLFGGG